jgi:hypothetical protein
MKFAVAPMLVLVTLLLAGCSVAAAGDGAAPSPSSSPSHSQQSSPSPSVNLSYSTAIELRDAAVRAGAVCNSWVPKKTLAGEADGGICDGSIAISIMSDVQSRNHVLELNAQSAEGQPFLVGSNWLYTDQSESGDPIASMKSLAAQLHGTFWEPRDPIPSA